MVPKVIHYCWFGGNPLPEMAKKCIESWKKYCPDYEIREWNESNFDLNLCDYVRQAAQAKKWAFVSDYARFWILVREGGIYFDTDVELLRPLDDLLAKGGFLGCEKLAKDDSGQGYVVAPGLGMAAEPGNPLCRALLDGFRTRQFIAPDGSCDTTTVVAYATDVLSRRGWRACNEMQQISGLWVYPVEYFGAKDYETGQIRMSENTRSIHHYAESWLNKTDVKIRKIERFCVNHFGLKAGRRAARVISYPLAVKSRVESLGLKGALHYAKSKLRR